MKAGDLIKFNKPRERAGFTWQEFVGTVAIVLESQMKPLFPNSPQPREYEQITIYSPALNRIVTGPAGNWDLVLEMDK